MADEIFKAFRKENFMIGAYFSKPDWHSPDYWWPYFPPKDRNVNYDPAKYPERWQHFKALLPLDENIRIKEVEGWALDMAKQTRFTVLFN